MNAHDNIKKHTIDDRNIFLNIFWLIFELLIIILVKNIRPKVSIVVPIILLIGKKKFINNVIILKRIIPNIGISDMLSLDILSLKKNKESIAPKENITELVKTMLNKSEPIYLKIKIINVNICVFQ